jgi:hypothetical protein
VAEASQSLLRALGGSQPPTLADVNELALHHSDFHILSFDGHRLVVVGSFDLCYYHGIELHFTEVAHVNCPVWFNGPEFSDEGRISDAGCSIDEPRRFVIHTYEGRYEIIARHLEVLFGTVYYYDRGEQLMPGERIAPWVKRRPAEPDGA